MNCYQLKDMFFGIDEPLMYAVKDLLKNTLVKPVSLANNLVISDRRLDEDDLSITPEALYSYFRKYQTVVIFGSMIFPNSQCVTLRERSPFNVTNVDGVNSLAQTLRDNWALQAANTRCIERIEGYCSKFKFTKLPSFSHDVFRVELAEIQSNEESTTFGDLLPLIHGKKSYLVESDKNVFLVFGDHNNEPVGVTLGPCTQLANSGIESFRDEFYKISEKVHKKFDQSVYSAVNTLLTPGMGKTRDWFEAIATKLLKEWVIYERGGNRLVFLAQRVVTSLPSDTTRITDKDKLIEVLIRLNTLGVDTGIIPGSVRDFRENDSYLGPVVKLQIGTLVDNYTLENFLDDLDSYTVFKLESRKAELVNIQPNKMTVLSRKERGLYKKYYQLLLDLFHDWNVTGVGVTLASADLEQDSFVLVQGAPIHRPDIDAVIGCLVSLNYLGVNRSDKGMVRVTPGLRDTEEGYTLRTLHFSDSVSGKPGKGDMYVEGGIQYQTYYQYNNIPKMLLALQEGGELHSYLFGKPLHRNG